MTIDSDGNVYVTSGRAVVVFDKTGQRLESIPVPESPSNICFGGSDDAIPFRLCLIRRLRRSRSGP